MPVAIPLAIAGASVAGAAISSNASKSAAKTVANSTDEAARLQNQQFEKLLALQMPGLNRANAAGDLYSRALGIPGASAAPQPAGQSYQTQPSMTRGGYSGGSYTDMPYKQQITDSPAGYAEPGMVRMMSGSYTNGQSGVPAPQAVPNQQSPAPAQGGGQLDIAAQVMGTPGYQTQLDQGLKSIDRAAPLVGGMYSGRRMKALNDYGQQTFGSYYSDWMDRVGGLAGQERGISSDIGNQGMQNARNIGGLMMTGANARANGALNSASAWTGALGNMAGGLAGYYG